MSFASESPDIYEQKEIIFLKCLLYSIRVPMKSFISHSDSGYKLLNSSGDDVTSAAIEK